MKPNKIKTTRSKLISEHRPSELRNHLFKAMTLKAKKKAVKGLRKAEAEILEEPKRLNMSTWGQPYDEYTSSIALSPFSNDVPAPKPPCGTVACIAGHVLMTSKEGRSYLSFTTKDENGHKLEYPIVDEFPYTTGNIAAKILGITRDQADNLFDPPGSIHAMWPEVFLKAYAKAKTAKQRAYVACNRIESFIESLQ